jgi:FixJ family two-component response regulator
MTKRSRIAVVDDDQSVRESVSGLLRVVGLAAAEYTSAEEFLRSADINETDCLILDVCMPGMDGLELQERLTASGIAIPIIFITAHTGDEELRRRALRGGAVGFLWKPLSEETVLAAVHQALHLPWQHD